MAKFLIKFHCWFRRSTEITWLRNGYVWISTNDLRFICQAIESDEEKQFMWDCVAQDLEVYLPSIYWPFRLARPILGQIAWHLLLLLLILTFVYIKIDTYVYVYGTFDVTALRIFFKAEWIV